ncbi:pyridoxamine 5'-phosphate oxidase family protein [Marinobacterium sediminicola]|uniref:Nitroimidazol reductase NimA-like FMN-containing flavoprotein (Pyridoxamine 5'-phosphate oxidase superfamily) n=1 Tax=Marinobacterium sediminicola TaxID=518898 RepID=A0ABY1S1S0_9GAMM|nr:pyridoxamine 5'-phosphate oxidase family protein [Marinobacterium sediminicola]ULG69482.1 pyridoxamine 5'-phosphate oxidase family protein [Marinobacterium sediminicola]SMR75632.1 hypothetical protein SAMN04487964_11124 [Marinobacterium sediminicola]
MSQNVACGRLSATPLTQLKRGAKRALTEREAMLDFIDRSLLCFVGFQIAGQVRVIPTCHWRDGDYLYWHGHSKAANVHGAGQAEQKVCITLATLDGLVMARSAFHHSVNYRSVMVYGVPEAVTDPVQKLYHFERFVEKLSPGRWPQLRPVTELEARATGIMRIKLDEASMKARAAGVVDDEEDMDWPVWAGVLPVRQVWGEAEQDPAQAAAAHAMPVYPDCDIRRVD